MLDRTAEIRYILHIRRNRSAIEEQPVDNLRGIVDNIVDNLIEMGLVYKIRGRGLPSSRENPHNS